MSIYQSSHQPTAETDAVRQRLRASATRQADWKNWGPYLSERAWGTVREDYSSNGDAWAYFPHDHARSRAYRWNEDGLGGVCNRFQNVCLAVALWNERDPILKERLFGVTNPEGNHGEDVKEAYFYLDNTPCHSYMKMLYKYPQAAFPYAQLIAENQRRGRRDPEFELTDALRTEFEQGRYFDVVIEYAKVNEEDLVCRITATNRGPEPAPLHILPHTWFRNTWSWGHNLERPQMQWIDAQTLYLKHRHLGERYYYVESSGGDLHTYATENDTNTERLYDVANASRFVKDGIHRAVVNGDLSAVNPAGIGSKAAAHFSRIVPAGESFEVHIRFSNQPHTEPFVNFAATFTQRIAEADEFYATVHPPTLSTDERAVQRQAFAGLLWSKQFYHYSLDLWLNGDPGQPPPPSERNRGRNADWMHLYCLDVLSMPDKWEYPWFAAWDLAFHTVPIAMIDPEWAKRQLILLLREWYMHPNGQIPAYEWKLDDVNPPVHAWAALEVFRIDQSLGNPPDYAFLKRIFHKLLLNFTWWVNRKDIEGNNVFAGGFLGLDNIGVFDRSAPLPTGGHLEQADGTAWMGMFCLNMLRMALELAVVDEAYEDVATKFFEHFIYIANAFYSLGGSTQGLWDEIDGFFYDVIHTGTGQYFPLKIRSFVGLIPLFAVEVIDERLLDKVPRFRSRMQWFIKYRPHLLERLYTPADRQHPDKLMFSIVNRQRLERILRIVLNPAEFLSPYGLRSLSKAHADQPYTLTINGERYTVGYEPAESQSSLFGGNSNWRGPLWLPMNYLVIHALRTYGTYYGDDVQVQIDSESLSLTAAADELAKRLAALLLRDAHGSRPTNNGDPMLNDDPYWRDYVWFHEYFHGDTGAGLGASHQTGWTALIAQLLNRE